MDEEEEEEEKEEEGYPEPVGSSSSITDCTCAHQRDDM